MKKLNKMIFTLTLLLLIGNSVKAQKWANAPKVILGVRGGITFAPTDWDGSNIEVFPTAGLAASFSIAKLPFYIETGLYYTNRYYSDWDNHSILSPALLSYHIHLKKNMSIQPFMGPFLAYGFDEDEIDFGCRMGVGFNKKHLYINCGDDISGNYGVDEDAFFVSVGYNF